MKGRILKAPAAAAEFSTRERAHILELITDADDEAVSVARARVEPGVTTELHALRGVDERYLILAGRGEMNLDGEDWIAVEPGDAVLVPADTAQRIRNPGPEDLVFYCVCTPPYEPSCYRPLE